MSKLDTTKNLDQESFYVHKDTSSTTTVTGLGSFFYVDGAVVHVYSTDPTGETVDPKRLRLEMMNLGIGVRVDVDDDDHALYGGPSLTSAQRSIYPHVIFSDQQKNSVETYGNDEPVGNRVFRYFIVNQDTGSHDIYYRFRIYELRLRDQSY